MKKLTPILLFLMLMSACTKDVHINEHPSTMNIKINNELSENEARTLLKNYSNILIKTKVENNTTFTSYSLNKKTRLNITDSLAKSTETISISEYIIKQGEKEGYSVILNDTRFPIVIAYVPEGSLNDTVAIEPLKYYFRSIPSLVSSIYKNYQISDDKESFANIINNMPQQKSASALPLSTAWHEDAPYNNSIDVTCSLGKALAGSHIVAMAQVMAYYKRPTYNWNRLLASSIISISNTEDADRREEVARLYKDIGKKTETTFDCKGTYASIEQVLKGFKAMGYTAVSSKALKSINIAQSTLKQEISINRRPVILHGTQYANNKNIGDHYWIADGYYTMLIPMPSPLFNLHINWGYGNDNAPISNGMYLYTDNFLGTAGSLSASSYDCFKNITAITGIY